MGFIAEIPPIYPLELFGIKLDITNEVVMLWVAAGMTLLLFVAAARRLTKSHVTTTRFTTLIESGVEFVQKNVCEEFLGHHAAKWAVFFAALFFFLLFSNLVGKIPGAIYSMREGAGWNRDHPHFWIESPTGSLSVTAALAVLVFLIAQIVGIGKLGPVGYFKKKFLMPAPLPIKIIAVPIMFLVLLAEPFSLAVRLFANMTAGHMVLVTFAGAELIGGLWLANNPNMFIKPLAALPFAMSVVLLMFELFIAFIQAFIFTLLSALYLSESLEEHH